VELNTPDYLGKLSTNSYNFIPLRGVSSSFDTVRLQWFSPSDVDSTYTNFVLQPNALTPLLSTWVPNKPPVIRAQVVQFDKDNGFKLTDFNNTNFALSQSNANTLFLYPSILGKNNYSFILDDVRRTVNSPIATPVAPAHPLSVKCSIDLASLYSCSADLKLPKAIGAGNREAYLFLGSLYNKASYSVSLVDSTSGSVVYFNNVQPEVDSTGRTSDLFRRVQTRVELTDVNFPYPRAAVDVSDNLCKDFRVTDNTADYQSNCTP
jgi:hypothetical protein